MRIADRSELKIRNRLQETVTNHGFVREPRQELWARRERNCAVAPEAGASLINRPSACAHRARAPGMSEPERNLEIHRSCSSRHKCSCPPLETPPIQKQECRGPAARSAGKSPPCA